ncbi:hypothetical protein RF679_15715 [Undibacterium cyanobacteriorum]|uniref:Uncharacterized protein n=1 Tax=Undibacterium cyanobacteriorum TaxID=3073561 RepID=A0ABY9RJ20_9BURK|nr:hypothetical protein [Undibacterium sp. 20NA77.5]WMW80081.1 hypothetical protein RF679_15715 [Undibacterium sp. 20NA77.5]
MELWQRRGIGILSIGGGAIGVAAGLQLILSRSNPIEWIFCLAFIAIYAWGVWSGTKFLEGDDRALRPLLKYWALQVPTFGSPILGYLLASGFNATVTYQFWPSRISGNMMLGSSFNYSLMQEGTPWSIGVNLFALVVTVWLYRVFGGLAPDNSPKQTAQSLCD